MSYKLDMFRDILPAIDRRKSDFFSRLTAEQRKGFAMPVALRWASAVSGNRDIRDWYILAINDRVNTDGILISRHPELQYRLLASCGIGSNQQHKWVAMPKRKPPTDVLYEFLRLTWETANDLECEIILKQIDEEKLVSLIRETGLDTTRSKEVIEAYERHIGKRARSGKAKGRKAK